MERGLTLYDRAAHEMLSVEYGVHDARACALYESALALWNMGFVEQARGQAGRIPRPRSRTTFPANLADSFGYAGLLFHLLHDPQRANPMPRALQISTEKTIATPGS